MSDDESNDWIDIILKAKNSSGEQELCLVNDGAYEGHNYYHFTLSGEYKGHDIQIDFDTMSREELEDYHEMIGLILDQTNNQE